MLLLRHALTRATMAGRMSRRRFKAAVDWARGVKKAELHLHLDGSLSPKFIVARAPS